MADNKAIDYARPKMLVPDGRGVVIYDKISIATTATNDTLSFAMPAGITVHGIRLHFDDIDAGTAMLFRVGYLKQNSGDTLTADDDYFAAAGQTTMQAGGSLTCAFHPIKFEIPWILQILLNTGGTPNTLPLYASAVVLANMNGVEGSSTTGLGVAV